MIVKIMHRETTLIDGVDEVQHKKVTPTNGQELSDLAMKFGAFHGSWYGPEMKEGQEPPMEAVLMRLVRGHKHESIVAVDARVFFMNENGQTVDKVVCW